jgi:hypothetical protein
MKVKILLTRQIFFSTLLLAILTTACTQAAVEERVAMTLTAIFSLQPSNTNTFTPEPSATMTLTSIPSQTATELPSPTFTETPTPSCLRLKSPEDKSYLSSVGKLTFKWAPLEGAARYVLEISAPGYRKQTFESQEPSLYRWLNTIPWSGDYSWKVTALDENGEVMCVSGSFAFNKPKFKPTPKPKNDSSGKPNPTLDVITPCDDE